MQKSVLKVRSSQTGECQNYPKTTRHKGIILSVKKSSLITNPVFEVHVGFVVENVAMIQDILRVPAFVHLPLSYYKLSYLSSLLFIQLNAQLNCSNRMLKFTLKFKLKLFLNFNGNFNILLEQPSCLFSWINKRLNSIKRHG